MYVSDVDLLDKIWETMSLYWEENLKLKSAAHGTVSGEIRK